MAHETDDHAAHGHHIIPISTLMTVFIALLALTGITVGLSPFDLGMFEIPVALGLATAKATLVVMIFMALKYDNPVNTLTFSVGVLFVAVFLAFTLLDTAFRGDMDNVDPLTVDERERLNEQLQESDVDPEDLQVAPGDMQ
ncbi:MAG: cytochrome C oxidase subunit IV family protein [Longimonas sp.]|uniref:cytochrome C oxidase subunit IV family protein n=1 Tax=Longimonas sp. TaxID=2039626 RepID=UPI003974A5A1